MENNHNGLFIHIFCFLCVSIYRLSGWPRARFAIGATIATQSGACCWLMAARGKAFMFTRPGLPMLPALRIAVFLLTAFAVGGCSGGAFDTGGWFQKPMNLFGAGGGYTYANLEEAKQDRPITQNDVVDANGACPRAAPPVAPGGAAGAAAAPGEAGSLIGGGIALGMSECDVVARLGQATAVNIGRAPNGFRNVVLTFNAGPRPGVYRFESGRLAEMDRVEVPPPAAPPPEKKKIAKKKPPSAQPQPKANGST
jgi:hypothetical protein